MDKDESGKQKIETATGQKEVIGWFDLPVAKEYAETLKDMLTELEESHRKVLSSIHEDAKSMFSNRRMLSYLENLVNVSYEMGKISVANAFAADFNTRKLEALGNLVKVMADQLMKFPSDVDLKKVTQMSEQLSHIDAIMQNVKTQIDSKQEEKKQEKPEKKDTSYVR